MKKHLLFGASLVMLLAVSSFSGSAKADSTPIPLSGWAWSSNIGWISFNSTDSGTGTNGVGTSPIAYSVTISTSSPCSTTAACLNGYAWSSNIGWVSFNKSDLDSAPACPGGSAAAAIANLTTGVVTGWVRAYSGIGSSAWDGCIQLSDNGTTNLNCPISSVNSDNDLCHASPHTEGARGVTYYASPDGTQGFLNGYSWESGAVGWLDFGGSITGGGSYGVSFPLDGTTPPCTPGDPGCTQPCTGGVCPITGTCTANGSSNLAPLPVEGGNVTFAVTGIVNNSGDGNTTYSDHWNGSVTPSPTYGPINYTVTTGSSPTVTINDALGATSGPLTCPSIVVATNPAPSTGVNLMITKDGVTPPSGDFSNDHSSLQITQGHKFDLGWNVNLTDDYSCSQVVPPGNWSDWSDASSQFDGIADGTLHYSTVTSIPALTAGQYQFGLSCSSDVNVLKSSSVILTVTSSSEGEQ